MTVARLDHDWNLLPGTRRRIEADAVCVGYGFTPQLELALSAGCATSGGFVTVDAAQATSVPGVFAAGEVTGIGGALLAAKEGTVAGTAAARAAGVTVRAPVRAMRGVRAGRRFAAALERAHPVREGWRGWLDEDTVVCRCEEVTFGQLRRAVRERGAAGVRAVKLVSRAGLGLCQGRVCGRSVAELTGLPDPGTAFAGRPLAAPLRLGELAEPSTPVQLRQAQPPPVQPRQADPPQADPPQAHPRQAQPPPVQLRQAQPPPADPPPVHPPSVQPRQADPPPVDPSQAQPRQGQPPPVDRPPVQPPPVDRPSVQPPPDRPVSESAERAGPAGSAECAGPAGCAGPAEEEQE
ncbi:(2Fe-2S)-binding protein [Streptomyces armeniacus]|uniref:(2Fe-2S)-binding protein n=1 Tax=Streptomyces armeniacus TaxID=83291 RepID=UPI00319DAA2B